MTFRTGLSSNNGTVGPFLRQSIIACLPYIRDLKSKECMPHFRIVGRVMHIIPFCPLANQATTTNLLYFLRVQNKHHCPLDHTT